MTTPLVPDIHAHWIAGGNSKDARRYGLTLKAVCGAVFIPKRRGKLGDKPPCPTCEEIDGPIPGARGREGLVGGGDRPRPHYVYRCYDAEGDLLYVGCTVDLVGRRQSHNAGSWWFVHVANWRVTIYPSKLHARRIERAAIRAEQPLCNVRHQDFSAWSPERLEKAMAVAAEAPVHLARLASVGGVR